MFFFFFFQIDAFLEYIKSFFFFFKNIPSSQYFALLTLADACLITSLRDGMNLTSHEYVGCQKVPIEIF